LKIKLYWPKCNFLNNQWVDVEIDSYWVECAFEEAEKNVFPYLSLEQIEQSKRNWKPKEKGSKDIGIETDRLCYLVSKDLKSIVSFPWYYPHSGHWNGYGPFEQMKEVEIKDLKDVSSIASNSVTERHNEANSLDLVVKRRKQQILSLVNSAEFNQLESYYSLNSFFNILNISRKETVHSDFLVWLLDPKSKHALNDYALKKLLETIILPINKAQESDKENKFPADLEDFIIAGNYKIAEATVTREKNTSDGFIDIYIEVELILPSNSKRNLQIIIENKVKSKEGSYQTSRYYKWAKDKDLTEDTQSIFVYLTPLSNVLFEQLTEPECDCKDYIQLNYQYIVDYVIEPVRKMRIPKEAEIFIDNYLRTLSYPSLQLETKENERGEIIMAIGEQERNLLRNFWEAHKELLIATITALRDDPEVPEDEREKLDEGLTAVIKVSSKDFSKYDFEGQQYAKNRLVHAVVKRYLGDHPDTTFAQLKEIFPDMMQGTKYCVFMKKSEAEKVLADSGTARHFLKESEILETSDEQIAVSTQWGINKLAEFNSNINKFIRAAKELSYNIN